MVTENNITQETEADTQVSTESVAEDTEQTSVESTDTTPEVQAETTGGTVSEGITSESPSPQTAPSSFSPAPETPPVASAEAVDHQYKQRLEQENEYYKQQAAMAGLEKQVADYEVQQHNNYVAQGYGDEQAAHMAKNDSSAQRQSYTSYVQQQQQHTQDMAFREGQYKASLHYAKQYGVDAQDLLKYQTPEAMEDAAKTQSRIKELEDFKAKTEQSSVPSQRLDSPSQVSSGELSGEALENAIGRGEVELTPDRSRKLQEYYRSQGVGG